MSTALAVAATSRVIAAIIDDAMAAARLALPGVLGSATTTSSPPDRIDTTLHGEQTNLNLFLYHVTYNQGWREVGLPTRNADGDTIGRAPLALDLHYLLSAYGSGDYEAQMMLGIGMQALHETPFLFRQKIDDVFAAPANPIDEALATANLQDQVELMKITPQQLTTDELAKLWTAFPSKFRVSAAYAVSVALIETSAPFTAALPVLARTVRAFPFVEPQIDAVVPQAVPFAAGATIVLQGSNLAGRNTFVSFGGAPDVLQPMTAVGANAVSVALPPLSAGINTLRAIRQLDLGEPAGLTTVVQSNVALFVLQPVVTSVVVGAEDATTHERPVTVTVDPALQAGQTVSLLLNELGAAPGTVPLSFMFDARAEDVTPPKTVVFRTAGVAGGKQYLLRVRVDGANSALGIDPATKKFNAPTAAF
jgi:hypothetical protein